MHIGAFGEGKRGTFMPISEMGTWHQDWEKAQFWVWYGQGWGSNLQAPNQVLLAPSLSISVTPETDSVHTSLPRDKMATSITGWRTRTVQVAALCGERVAITPALWCESDYLPQCPHKSEQWLRRCAHIFPLSRLAFSVAAPHWALPIPSAPAVAVLGRDSICWEGSLQGLLLQALTCVFVCCVPI